jgi:hypothetical protein
MLSAVLSTTSDTQAGNLRKNVDHDMATKVIFDGSTLLGGGVAETIPRNELGLKTMKNVVMLDEKSIPKTTSTPDVDGTVKFEKELKIDSKNTLQLEDQAFWERSLSMSMSTLLGEESYIIIDMVTVGDPGNENETYMVPWTTSTRLESTR